MPSAGNVLLFFKKLDKSTDLQL